MAKYIMALDAGTTSNRCILFDPTGAVCSMAQKEFTQYFPQPGWVEHDPEEIWSVQLEVARQAMRNAGAVASASQTSGKPLWSGTGPPAGPCTRPLSGSAAARRRTATG